MLRRSLPIAIAAVFCLGPGAFGQGLGLPGGPDVTGLGGALLFHGNYCGPGNRGYDKAPIDALDAACRAHDLCTPAGDMLPRCNCNARLARDAQRVADNPRQEPDLRALAGVVSGGAALLPCAD